LETINIKVDLSIITHAAVSEHPFVNISLNGYPQFGKICEQDTVIDIDVEIQDNTENFLTVEYYNKFPMLDVQIGHDGEISKDKRVEINSISFDDIELDFYHIADPSTIQYETIDPMGQNSTGSDATKLSWNGKTTLRFTTPIYIWILENL